MKNDIRTLREGLGLTQEQLAERVGVSRQTINAIETSRYNPTLPLAIRLARLMQRPVEEIFHVNEE